MNHLYKYKNNINWERMIIYLSACDKDVSIYADIIEKNNLWKVISANDLPIDFIRKHKSKLDWSILSIIKDFSEEEYERILLNIKINEAQQLLDSTQFKFGDDYDLKGTEEWLELRAKRQLARDFIRANR